MRLILDVGTTNARLYALDARGEIVDQEKRGCGVAQTAVDGHPGALKAQLRQMMHDLLERQELREADVEDCVAYGMITSGLGLREVSHVCAPAGAQELRNAMEQQTFPEIASFPIRFIPGVRNHAEAVTRDNLGTMDMMRGEETEALGLWRLMKPEGTALLVLPGTHNKLVLMDEKGSILGLRTTISGELLGALSKHTILSQAVGGDFVSPDDFDEEWAIAGLSEGLQSGLGRAAFGARLMTTLGGAVRAQAASYLLGVTTATDMEAMKAFLAAMKCREAHILLAGKEPVVRTLALGMLEASLGEATVVPQDVAGRMGVAGAAAIAWNE